MTVDKAQWQTFTHGLAAVTGNQVQVVVRGTQALTNGRTVFLPDQGYWAAADFDVLCGVACHEVAHVWFKSIDHLKSVLAQHPPDACDLVRNCYNAVIDVADETRFEFGMPAAEKLFKVLREQTLQAAMDAGRVAPRPPAVADSYRQLLVVAIWLARSEPRSRIRRVFWGWRSRMPGLREACRILNRARERQAGAAFEAQRTARQWQRIGKLVGELVDLVRKLFPTTMPQQPPGPSPGIVPPHAGGSQLDGDPMGEWYQRVVAAAVGRAGCTPRADADADPVADRPDSAFDDDDDDDFDDEDESGESVAGSGLLDDEDEDDVEFDEESYRQLAPSFRGLARLLAGGPSIAYEEGFSSGCRLSRPHRALIDGKCFRRRTFEEAAEAAVALAIDHSFSMEHLLGEFLPVAAAMADALDALPDVEVAVWRFGSDVERLARIDDLRRGRLMGATATHLALRQAAAWLAGRTASRRVAVLFTDGSPDDAAATRREALRLRALGARLLVGSIGSGLSNCHESLPGAVAFHVAVADAASSLQVAMKRIQS